MSDLRGLSSRLSKDLCPSAGPSSVPDGRRVLSDIVHSVKVEKLLRGVRAVDVLLLGRTESLLWSEVPILRIRDTSEGWVKSRRCFCLSAGLSRLCLGMYVAVI